MIKRGLEWIGKTWTGLIKHGLIKHGVIKHGLIKHGVIKHGLIKHGVIQQGFMTKQGKVFFLGFIRSEYDKHDFKYFCHAIFAVEIGPVIFYLTFSQKGHFCLPTTKVFHIK